MADHSGMKEMKMLPVLLLTSLMLWLAGCETLVRESEPGDWVPIPPQSHLNLLRPVTIQPGRTRALIAQGDAARTGTTCALEVRRLDHESGQSVEAGRYRITRVQNYLALVSSVLPSWRADAPRVLLAGHGDSGGSQMVRLGYHFWLDGGEDPNLMRLTCLGRMDIPVFTRAPTLAEIRSALDGVAILELGERDE